MTAPRNPAGRPEVRLSPALQEQLLEQMREEQAAALLRLRIRNYVIFPGIAAVTVLGIVLAFSSDPSVAITGNLLASSILLIFWKLRKRIAATIGF
jgi:hypothetical protein